MTLNETLIYLIDEANSFNAGAAWGVSDYAMVIHETVARMYEHKTDKTYPGEGCRPYSKMPLVEFIKLAKETNAPYETNHPLTVSAMNVMFILLERTL